MSKGRVLGYFYVLTGSAVPMRNIRSDAVLVFDEGSDKNSTRQMSVEVGNEGNGETVFLASIICSVAPALVVSHKN